MFPSKILFQLSGSIAAYKSCEVLSRLVQQGHEVRVVATPSALKFVGPATLEGLSGQPLLSDIFEPQHLMDHIHWARWCDLALLCPASANSINRLANGLADDLIGALYLAIEPQKPYLIAPAMNHQMLAHPATKESLERLQKRGARILPTDEGELACGEKGAGRLLSPDQIVHQVHSALSKAPREMEKNRLSILVTAGGTSEPLDEVRFISNMSTGRTGALISNRLHQLGHQVVHLSAEAAQLPQAPVEKHSFFSFGDLQNQLQTLLHQRHFDLVIHLAAVSDFSVDTIRTSDGTLITGMAQKLPSSENLTIHLRKNPKLVHSLKSWSKNKDLRVVAFKLTHSESVQEQIEAVARLLKHSQVDQVVHNDLIEIRKGQHCFKLYDKAFPVEDFQTVEGLIQALLRKPQSPVSQELAKEVSP